MDQGMEGGAQHAALYGRLRARVLARHFAVGKYFRANLLSLTNALDTPRRAADVLALDPASRELERWRVDYHVRENPLMYSGLLLTCLAVEHALGGSEALPVIRAALASIGSLYKFRGAHFDGYVLRWDPVTSDNWVSGPASYCQDFLLGADGQYLYCSPTDDPRAVPLRTAAQLSGLSDLERQDYQNRHWEYVDRFRRWEVSQDELVGLVLAYFMVHHHVSEPDIQAEVRRQVANLGDYLAEHAYLLVRPYGGFTARGAAGLLPALEYPFGQVFQRITGDAYPSRTDMRGALEKAGLWTAVEATVNKWAVLGVAAEALLPLVTTAFGAVAQVVLGTWLDPVQMSQAAALLERRDCFDSWSEGNADEFALASLVKAIGPRRAFELWLTGTGVSGRTPTSAFPPFLALTALDGADPNPRQRYLSWLAERTQHPQLDPVEGWGAGSCFATAVAAVLGGGPEWEARLVARLERAYARIALPPAQGGLDGELPLEDELDNNGQWQGTSESLTVALDYLAGLSLAWLHAARHEDAGAPVAVAGFPAPPRGATWPRPTVPTAVVEAARAGALSLPLDALQPEALHVGSDGADVFLDGAAPAKPTDAPPPVLPPPPTQLLYDVQVGIREENRDVDTGITLESGDELELEATGTIQPGVIGAGLNGPDGWADRIVWSTAFPLHGAIDPVNAHPYCLLGRLNGYFFVGQHRPRQRYLAPWSRRLYLRINDDVPGNGSGTFICRVRVWGAPRG